LIDITENLSKRERILVDSYDDPGVQEALVEKCKEDITFFFNFFLWTYNPKLKPYHFPFQLFPAQAQVVRWIHEDIQAGRGTLCEKSRDWGATYIYLGIFLYHFLFGEFEGLLLSLRQDEVDNPTPSSLFAKLRYMAQRLPWWMLPQEWQFRKHGAVFLRFVNPDNGNTIVGQATTEDAGRSGRKTAVLVDEYASIRNRIGEGMERSLRYTTDSLHRLSTPKGVNLFKQIRDKRPCRVITCHWTQDPRKCEGLYYRNRHGDKIPCDNLPYERRSAYGNYITTTGTETEYKLRSTWYDREERAAITKRDLAQEVDIKYIGSGYCRFDAEMLESKSKLVRDGARGYLVEEDGEVVFREAGPEHEFEVEIWEFPQDPPFHHRSVGGVDTAEGLEHGDFCSADILTRNIRGDHATHAAALHGHWKPDIFADKLDLLGRFYDAGAWLCIERNKDGLAVILRLLNQLNYTNIYHDDYEHEKLGFYTTDVKKALITEALDKSLRDGELETLSLNHFTEMSQFENVNGKLGATGSNNDDRVISLCLAWWLVLQLGKPSAMAERRKPVKDYRRFKPRMP